MKRAVSFKFLFYTMLGLALGLVSCFAVVLMRTHREYAAFFEREQQLARRLAEVRVESALRDEYLRRLQEDPAFYDRVVRERLGYVESDEIVFRFEKENRP